VINGSTRPVFKTGWAILFVTCNPFVNGFSANPIKIVELGDGKLVLKKVTNELGFLVHGTGLLPRHRQHLLPIL
jgi:hypothetical protein